MLFYITYGLILVSIVGFVFFIRYIRRKTKDIDDKMSVFQSTLVRALDNIVDGLSTDGEENSEEFYILYYEVEGVKHKKKTKYKAVFDSYMNNFYPSMTGDSYNPSGDEFIEWYEKAHDEIMRLEDVE